MTPPGPVLAVPGGPAVDLALAPSLKITFVPRAVGLRAGEGCCEDPGRGSTDIRVLAWFRRDAPKPNSLVRPS